MEQKNLIIICLTAIICVLIVSVALIIVGNNTQSHNDTNDTVNITLNDTNTTQTNATTTKKTTKSSKKADPDYDPERDSSHKHATEDNPVTVQQSDGEYTYYGPGHYDYYAGDNHMSGEYYKNRNNQ